MVDGSEWIRIQTKGLLDMESLLKRLAAWTEEGSTFHGDRQLADEILVADGWTVHQDDKFEGGFRWQWGINPTICSSESTRPHPIRDMNAAIGVVPYRCSYRLNVVPGQPAKAMVWMGDESTDVSIATGTRPQIALVIAALQFKQMITKAQT